ncbi:MAG: decarboxylating 6-phosphogluconate dehydrogenase [Candidatus Nanopelagicales bacterium]|jgi:6-phosphogluconate dehydrogenase|nr:decarboxylating 6-phosphogluconate dehydrogenase [Candidatus Nanopelagicales bacterium]MDP4715930.1 decarboxylating 6-phosphogluconate dehydrogenase [Candidatus Nanopelagicales bacterium]MDP4906539.1 decarboxylating 6-phosphogluconate dehydrogenase [Candidatus Nanopelagicales bacterium]MDP4975905.1 decarboxylating 6-phosphogluconate dehydrogenase [Candidatus Nanopelagicales bacterium]MDP5094981.1 decarboxylating 6-phosphogluconate dehydrogenase [Candidatus Nanopelagicales bacterium]
MATSEPMQLGMVGLGRMGANIVRRVMRDGHSAVVFDRDPRAVADLVGEGATGADSLADLVRLMTGPRNIWVMVPAGSITEAVVDELSGLLSPGDAIIDGGNSYYRDDIRRAAALDPLSVHYIDCGTSGGVWGLERGYSLMIGGDDESVNRLVPIWASVAPGVESAERTGDRIGELVPGEAGWLHCGPHGAGHFVKMVHNGIEYGIMAAYAEGLNILKHADTGSRQRSADAETAPLDHPEFYQYTFDLPAVTEVWRRGSVIGSWLLDLTALALSNSSDLSEFTGRVSDSGEGRWTSIAAIEEGVPTPVLTEALFSRFDSQGMADYAYRVMSAQRKEFGGHDEKSR